MKKATLIGLIALLLSIFTASQLNGALIIQEKASCESVFQLENSEIELESDTAFLPEKISMHLFFAPAKYSYKSDFLLFDLTKDLFRPPSHA